MARFRVVKRSGGWIVTKNGQRHFKKTYQTKRAAIDAAHRAANPGDSVQGQRVDGTWGNERTKGTYGPRGDQR